MRYDKAWKTIKHAQASVDQSYTMSVEKHTALIMDNVLFHRQRKQKKHMATHCPV